MEKKFTVSAKIKGVIMEFIPKELAGCISTKKNAFIGHCAKRPRDDALVDEYNINDRAMIKNWPMISSRTSRLVQEIYATLLLRSLSLLFCGPCSLFVAVETTAAPPAGTVPAGVSSSEAEVAKSGLRCDDLCSGVGTCTEHFS